jgi:alkanesulfonate monooxygenase SsuD/methylene tetrahydromethanopterin reductase-like flavin-dependent oxidoreductase (luciferase family)
MIAGEGEKRTLKTCALYGDMSNYAIWRGKADDFRRKTGVLEKHCDMIGRNPEEILKTWPAFTFIDSSQENAKQYSDDFFEEGGGGIGGLIGTPETMIQTIYEFIDAGARLIILSFLGPNWRKEVDLFVEEVKPEFN